MAKVVPGPVASDLRGSIASVTYYRLMGQLVVRARVRPHQKISSGRWWARKFMKDSMGLWRVKKKLVNAAWIDDARGRMHGVNRFIQLNYPLPPVLSYVWPPAPAGLGVVDVWWGTHLYGRNFHFSWNPADFPGWETMLFHFDAPTYHSHGYESEPVSEGSYNVIISGERDCSWFFGLTNMWPVSDQPDYRQFQRTLFEDIPGP